MASEQLEQEFRTAIANLSNYKRGVVWEYVNALNQEITSLAAFKASVDEACNTGDGSYRP